jgi:hypothetical protein
MAGFVNAAMLAAMQRDAVSSMNDTCEFLAHGTGAVDAYGKPVSAYTVIGTSACGVEHANAIGEGGRPSEALGKTEVPRMTRQLRLPLTADVNHLARVRVTHRYGVALVTPELYEVVGLPQRGPSGFVTEIRREMMTQ